MSNNLKNLKITNGAKRTRTADPCNAIAVLYQLSYNPKFYSNDNDNASKRNIRQDNTLDPVFKTENQAL
jgi:hypothetical protein